MASTLRNAIILVALLLGSGTALAAQDDLLTKPAATEQILADDAYYPALLAKIRGDEKSINLVMYLWKISGNGGGKPAELVRALGESRKRGVVVKVILEYSAYDDKLNQANQETAALLKREGIPAFFDSPAITTHTKFATIDQRFCFVGSHNLTQSALERNREISLLLDNPRLAGELGRYLETISPNN